MSASSRIRDIALAKLPGRTIDVVGFIDELLAIAPEIGPIRCCLRDDRALHFELGPQDRIDVELDSARAKLRMLCARLGVLCNETSGATVSLYGGDGQIAVPSANGVADKTAGWTIRFKNTPADHEFSIVPFKAAHSQMAGKRAG